MIAEKFGEIEKEFRNIRSEMGENFQAFTDACSKHLHDSKNKTESDLAKQLQRIKTDHGKRIADINMELTKHLAGKTSFQSDLNKIHITAANLTKSQEEMDQRLDSLPSMDYYDDQLSSLQMQITSLAKGLPTVSTPGHTVGHNPFRP